MKNTEKEKKFHFFPQSVGLWFGFLVAIIAEAIFMYLVFKLDIFPANYVSIMIGALVFIDIIILLLLGGKKKKSAKHVFGLIVVMLLVQALLVGDIYVYSTYNTLQKISKYKATWEIYDVVSLTDGKYQTVDDIEGEKVYMVDMTSKQLTEASERLVTKANVDLHKKSDLVTVCNKLVDDEGNTNDKIMLISKPNYQLMKEQNPYLKEKTHVIYKIKVKKRADDTSKAVDVTQDSFNVLISGVDVWGSIDQTALSDVNMVMTVNPKTRDIMLTSIPRDSYVKLHSSGQMDKLTHSGVYGEDETRETIEDFLDIDINYTIKVNFSMLVDIINAIDGIDVKSEYEFESSIHHCDHHDTHYEKGWNHMNGKEALYFARERKSFIDGDMQRNKDQQLVLEAMLKKITSSKVIMTRYTQILAAVEDEMTTTLTDQDFKKLARMQLKDMSKSWTINRVSIEGSTGGAPCWSMGNRELSCVFPSDETVEEAKKAIHDTMYPVDNTIKKNEPTQQTDENGNVIETEATDGEGTEETTEATE